MTTKSELLELIANGENSGVEFKRDDIRPEHLAKEVVALANLQGGKIILGVEDDGTITGIHREELQLWVMDTVFGHYVHPMIIPFYEEVQVDEDRRVAVISLTQGTSKPYVVRHSGREEIYVRFGSVSRRASRELQARLFASGGMLRAEMLPVSGSGLVHLCKERLTDYLIAVVRDPEPPGSDEAWEKRLCDLGFMVERADSPPVCTVAGLLLFGYSPRKLFTQAGIRWMAFDDADKSYQALDDRVIDGPLVALWRENNGDREFVENGLIEDFIEIARPFLSEEKGPRGETMRRERYWHYPLDALREAVVNALAHRDWTRCEEVEISRYSNRLEIISPGALHNSMTVGKMIAGQRSPRNSLVVEVLRDYGYVDARGMGVRNKIIPLVRKSSGSDPDFQATEDYLRLVIPKRQPGGTDQDAFI
jgi:ATP-dependent DNA helicase RecG